MNFWRSVSGDCTPWMTRSRMLGILSVATE